MTEQQERKFERIRGDILQAILTDEVAGRLADLHNLISQTIPQGIVQTLSLSLSGRNLQQHKPDKPWFSFSLKNKSDSSGTVYARVNRENADEHAIAPDDTWDVSMGAAKIEMIYLRTDDGQTASIILTGVR